MLKVGAIEYINTLPFFAALQAGILTPAATLYRGVPAELNRRLREGEIDLSLISSAEYLQHKNQYTLIPEFCIAAREQVLSVCLYSQLPLANLTGKTIAVTPESASSTQLLKVLCKHFWKVTPQFALLPDRLKEASQARKFDALLLIGDLCLHNPSLPGYQTIDLAQAWYYATGLPFVFAVLAVRSPIMQERSEEVAEFSRTLQSSLEWARAHKDSIIEIAQQQCPIPESTLRRYFDLLHYNMTKQHLQGLERFHQLSQLSNL